MAEKITGRCQCGAVSYVGERADVPMFRCYCRDCQRLTGGGHAEMVPMVAASLDITGPAQEYQMTGGSGRPTWSVFCGTCGSQISRRSARSPERRYVHAASLDHPEIYRPEIVIYTQSAQPWDGTVPMDEDQD